ncbi:unnamed protein product [Arabidopsis arenosa]|uniref:Tubby C-terminal domain-containing protein n=1 Tax=Arabidopsis arenosa TaxID=38785 RepID=A0A8S1ZEL0_ARAAE|nr:unnamed protein product [Arabidopsis arenosa]
MRISQVTEVAQAAAVLDQSDPDKTILKFDKIREDMFSMEFRHLLSAIQTFHIFVNGFDTKLAYI